MMVWESYAPHHVDITQAVDPEGVQVRRDNVQLIGFKGLLTLYYCAVESGADPPVHTAHRSQLTIGKGRHMKNTYKTYEEK